MQNIIKTLSIMMFGTLCSVSHLSAECCFPDTVQGPMGPQGIPGAAGPQGAQGPMGSQGTQGTQGPPGLEGIPGVAGPQGAQGPMGSQGTQGPPGLDGTQGPQGVQGPQGPEGPCCPHITAYANVYSNLDQTVPAFGFPGMIPVMELANAVSCDFDITLTPTLGTILFLRHGIYQIIFSVQGRPTDFKAFPTPPFSFGLFLNGSIVRGSVISTFAIAPDDLLNHAEGIVIIEVMAGDVLSLGNVSSFSVDLVALPPTGGIFPSSSASICIGLIKAL